MKSILKRLEKFDVEHGWDRYNRIRDDRERMEALGLELLNVFGELGELANELKKCRRDGEYRPESLREETTDAFVFLLKVMLTLEMDPEEEFEKKMEQNEERFESFHKKESNR